MTLRVGQKAPAFSCPDQNGKTVTLASLKGKTVVLYFYPKAMTPGCTVQAQCLRDVRAEFSRHNAVVLGISPDEPKSLKKFEEKEKLTFTLLADSDHTTADAYGVWVEKSMYGKKYMGVARTTFIVGPDGTGRHILEKVDTKTHHTDVLAWLTDHADELAV